MIVLSRQWWCARVKIFLLFRLVNFRAFILFCTLWFDWREGFIQDVGLVVSIEVEISKEELKIFILVLKFAHEDLFSLFFDLFLVYVEAEQFEFDGAFYSFVYDIGRF